MYKRLQFIITYEIKAHGIVAIISVKREIYENNLACKYLIQCYLNDKCEAIVNFKLLNNFILT